MKIREIVLAVSVGIAAALLRLAYLFFPYVSVADVLVFVLVGFGVARTHPSKRWGSFLLVILPTLACIGVFLALLGPAKLSSGIGTGHLRGALLVPVAASLGFLLQGRFSQKPAAA